MCSTLARRCGPRFPSGSTWTGLRRSNPASKPHRPSAPGWSPPGRVVGRLADDRLHGYRREKAVGVRVDLTTGREAVTIDIEGEPTLIWSGPGIAPMAVAAIYQLYGAAAMIEHPGLAPLRAAPDWPQGPDQLERP